MTGLRRPTVVAWGLDQLAHRHPDLVAGLRDRAEQVRAAHEGAVAGERTGLAAADDELRQVIRRMAARAAEIVVDEDVAASGHRDEIERALWAAAVDPQVADDLERGMLQATPEPPAGGFALGAVGVSDGDGDGATERHRRTARATLRRLDERRERVERQVRRRRDRVQQLEERLTAEQQRLEDDEAELTAVEDERGRAQATLDRISDGGD